MTALQIPTAALPAWEALGRALIDYRPPCTSTPDQWFPTREDDVRHAATRCRRCQVLTACDRYATAAHESVGVWAGVDRERPQANPTEMEHATVKATTTDAPPICPSCGADSFGCTVKSGLSGQRCCDDCPDPKHEETR